MPSLLVLFERTPSLPSIGEALRRGGLDLRPEGADAGSVRGPEVTARLTVRSGPVTGRAIAEAAALSAWAGATAAVGRHGAWVRLESDGEAGRRGGGEGGPAVMGALDALLALTRAAGALLRLPGVVALLDEVGRALSDPEEAMERLADGRATPPLELWIAQRSFELADARGFFLDTLGMAQLGLPDLEAYAGDGAARAHTGAWLKNLTLYLVQDQDGRPLRHGDTLDGPDDRPWSTTEDRATVEPERAVLRFAPL